MSIRSETADYLRNLAKAVEEGHVLAFEVKWGGDKQMDTMLKLHAPLDFIQFEFEAPETQEGRRPDGEVPQDRAGADFPQAGEAKSR